MYDAHDSKNTENYLSGPKCWTMGTKPQHLTEHYPVTTHDICETF